MRAIVFVLNGCPSGWLGPYGNELAATPNLDRLAAGAVTFDAHVSDCPDPAAARRAWRTGRHQFPPFAAGDADAPAADADLLYALRAAGVRTVLVRGTRADDEHGDAFAIGWDEVVDARPEPGSVNPSGPLTAALPPLLERLADVPEWLIWVETDRLLPPWTVPQDVFSVYVEDLTDDGDDTTLAPDEPDEMTQVDDPVDGPDDDDADSEPDDTPTEERDEESEPDDDDDEPEDASEIEDAPDAAAMVPWSDPPTGWFDRGDLASWEYLHRTFAALVTTFDAELGRLFDRLRETAPDAAWVVTADFGLPLGEHGTVGRFRPHLHEERVHLPLFVRLPGGSEGGRRVPGFSQPADLFATVLDLFGVPCPADAHGRSLLPLARGEAESVRAYAVSGLADGPSAEWAIRTPDWALLLPTAVPADDPPRGAMMFEKPGDRWEVNDLRQHHLEWVEYLETVIRDYAAAARKPGPLVAPSLRERGDLEPTEEKAAEPGADE